MIPFDRDPSSPLPLMDWGCIQDCPYHRHWEIFLIKSRVAAKALGVWVDSCLWISNWRSTCCRSVEALEEEHWILSKRESHIGDHGMNPLVFELIAAQRIKGWWNVSDFINHYPIAVTTSNCMKLLVLCEFTFMKHEILILSWQKLDRMRVTNLRVTDARPKTVQVNYWQCGYMKSLDKKIPLFTKHISFQNSKFLASLSSHGNVQTWSNSSLISFLDLCSICRTMKGHHPLCYHQMWWTDRQFSLTAQGRKLAMGWHSFVPT